MLMHILNILTVFTVCSFSYVMLMHSFCAGEKEYCGDILLMD